MRRVGGGRNGWFAWCCSSLTVRMLIRVPLSVQVGARIFLAPFTALESGAVPCSIPSHMRVRLLTILASASQRPVLEQSERPTHAK